MPGCNFIKILPSVFLPVAGALSFLILFFQPAVNAQTTPSVPSMSDSMRLKSRTRLISAVHIGGYGIAMGGLYQAWYKDYEKSAFHSFNDWGEWRQMDKFGHVFSAYAEGKASLELWKWAGMEHQKAVWIAGLSGVAYQTIIETLDGFCEDWGWSWGDFGANIAGSGLLVSQELLWGKQIIQPKFSFRRKQYGDPVLENRSDSIFGKSSAERWLKDYNGQTYWVSVNLKTLFPESGLPAWIQLSAGTGVENIYGARSNIAYDKNGNKIFDAAYAPRYRQWYLAPDIDLTKIPTRKAGVRMLLNMLNIFKFPAPAVEYGNGRFKLHWLYF
jgi:hypothetical protein